MAENTSTVKKYLDYAGLVYLWTKIKNTFVKKTDLATFVKKTDLATTGATGLVVGGTFKAEDVASGYSEAPIVDGKVYYANHETISTSTEKTTVDEALKHGDTVVIPTVTVSNGHVTKITETTYTLPSEDTTMVKASGDLVENQVVLGGSGKNVKTTGVTLGGTALTNDTTGTVLATETAVNAALDDLKDEIGALENVMNFLGVVQLAEGVKFDTLSASVTISGKSVTAVKGDVVVYGNEEYVWDGGAWHEIGQVKSDEAVTSLEDVKGDITLGTGLSIDKTNKKLDVELAATQGNVTLDKTNGLKADVSVTNSAASLAFGSTSTIATVAGTDITVTMPGDPTADISALSTHDIDNAILDAEGE